MITGFYASLCAFFLIFLIINVVRRRYRYKTSLGAGGHEELERYIRAHGNFVETVPVALILMFLVEWQIPYMGWVLHWLGVLLIIGRISHYVGLTTGKGYGSYRMAGMLLMMWVYIIASGFLLSAFFQLV